MKYERAKAEIISFAGNRFMTGSPASCQVFRVITSYSTGTQWNCYSVRNGPKYTGSGSLNGTYLVYCDDVEPEWTIQGGSIRCRDYIPV